MSTKRNPTNRLPADTRQESLMKERMVTLRRADGQALFDEYSHIEVTYDNDPWSEAHAEAATAVSGFPEEDDEPVEYVLETWRLVRSETLAITPSEAKRSESEEP